MSEAMDRINEAADRVTANIEAYNLGFSGGDPKKFQMLLDAMGTGYHQSLNWWYGFGLKESAKAVMSPTLDEVNARRGYEDVK
jgi:hypothetical protein